LAEQLLQTVSEEQTEQPLGQGVQLETVPPVEKEVELQGVQVEPERKFPAAQVWQLVAEPLQEVQAESQAEQVSDCPPVEKEVELQALQVEPLRKWLMAQVWQFVVD
jgi:hypothetical protein